MKRTTVFGLVTFAATAALLAAESGPKEAVTDAATKLAQQANYSWKTATEFGNFNGASEGKTQKDGLVGFTMTFGDNTTEAFLKDGKGAVKAGDQDWQSLADLAGATGDQPRRGQFLLRLLQNLKAPAAEASNIAGKTK